MASYVLTPYAEYKADKEQLTALQFICKYAGKLSCIVVEFHSISNDPTYHGTYKCYYRSNFLHMQEQFCPSDCIGQITDDEIHNILSLRQWEQFSNGSKYRFTIDNFFIKAYQN